MDGEEEEIEQLNWSPFQFIRYIGQTVLLSYAIKERSIYELNRKRCRIIHLFITIFIAWSYTVGKYNF